MKFFHTFFIYILFATSLLMATNTLTNAEIKRGELHLHFSSFVTKKNIHKMVLSDPPRLVVDIKKSKLKSSRVASGLQAKGVKSFRVSQRKNNTIRIVIETYSRYKARTYQPMAYNNVFVITLPKDDFIHISDITKKRSKQRKKSKSHKPKPKHKPIEIEEVPDDPIVQDIIAPKEKTSVFSSIFGKSSPSRVATSSGPRRGYTVVVDAGHGGHDSGAIGARKYYEKNIVLQIAKRVALHLKRKNFNVKMTRSSDRFIKLRNRTKIANRYKADIFVSIHANAIANRRRFNKVYGVETYFLQTTRSAKAMRVAAKENSVVLDKVDRLSNSVILEAVLSGPKIELSHKLAIDVQSNILKNLRHKYRGVKDGGVIPAPFWVLVGAQMPSVLVEVGYISNPKERSRLMKADYQDRIAKGIAEGISNYLAIREKEFN